MMMPSNSLRTSQFANFTFHTLVLKGLVISVSLLCASVVWAQEAKSVKADGIEHRSLKVCQDPDNMPFSNTKGDGIENKLAELFAKDLGIPVSYFSFPQRMAFVRNTLRYKLPNEDYRCDIMMGVPAGFDQVATTNPYYQSTYVMVFAKGKALNGVQTSNDLLKLDPAVRSKLRIGVFDRSPAADWLAKHELIDQGIPYRLMTADPGQYPGKIIEEDLANNKIDVAILWGPLGAYYAQRVTTIALQVVPMVSEPGARFDYAMAMGVRYGEPEWKKLINDLIVKLKPQIQAILRSYNVPLVETKALAQVGSSGQ